ncbi:zeatin O-glucosyltransferase-like [Rutidosis leptorrhynchoides]|uniref:zeatin O-glucosyltransferase-like n=1 Tax=Rutidosis leptorrhynchoides TaxID=125765 RepID=UPI003A99E1A0
MVTHKMSITNQNKVVILIVPLPLQGHLNQLLHLSRLISTYNVPVHVITTTTYGRQAKLRLQGWDPNTISNIYFHDYPIPSYASPPPNPNSANKFPSHLLPICEAATHLRGPVAALLHKLGPTTQRLVIIHDSLMGSVVQDFILIPNAESYTFHSVSAFSIALYISKQVGEQIQKSIEPQALTRELISFEGCFSLEFKTFISSQHEYTKLSLGRIYNSCRVVEQATLDLLEANARNNNKLLWALGPFNPVDIKSGSKVSRNDGGQVAKCLNWLDKQSPNTVIYVSFGTTTTLSQDQIIEIAIGLEKSDQKFIWVVREADKGDIFVNNSTHVELPEGFEDKVEDRGFIVKEWAPQLEILAHSSIGGFMSHCGWNSCMESISMGVPIAAWPIHSDQPNNAVLVTKVLKVGLLVKEWCQQDEVVESIVVENAVRTLMGSRDGEEIRKRAMVMGHRVRKSTGDGGVSQMELESFIRHLSR